MPDNPVPLATVEQMSQGPFGDLIRSFSPQAASDLMVEATRACETESGRRLAPFTAHVESHRCDGVDPDEYTDAANLPMDLQGTLGKSYASALGVSTLVRHAWLNEYAPLYPEYWAYTNVTVQIIRSYGGGEMLGPAQFDGPEPDSGHLWYHLGRFIPMGSLARITYGGGYIPAPADLARACKYMAASIAATELDPLRAQHGHDPGALEAKALGFLTPYTRS